MRTVANLNAFEITSMIKETVYYYLLANILNAVDQGELFETLKNAKSAIEDATLINKIRINLMSQVNLYMTIEDFDDILRVTIEDYI